VSRWTRALVTGASSGIGEALARRLASEGVNLVLVARRRERLVQLADELGGPTTVEALPVDLGDSVQRAEVEARVADPASPVDLLVNNAATGGTLGPFREQSLDAEQQMLEVNVVAVVRLSHAAARAMAPRGHGSILNVSSIASRIPTPGAAVYAASKSFVTTFTEALHLELRDEGLTATVVSPGITATEMPGSQGYDLGDYPGFAIQSADGVAAFALDAVAAGKAAVVPGAVNKTMAAALKGLPSSLVRRAAHVAGKRNR